MRGDSSRGTALLLLPAILFVVFLFLYPFGYGLYMSFTKADGSLSLANYARFFADPRDLRTIGVTLGIALPVTLLAVAAAVPLSYHMRHGVPGEKAITFFLIVPVTLGTVLVSEGMLTFMGPNGWLNQLVLALGLADKPLQLTHNYAGVAISVGLQGFPYAFLMLLGYVSGINPDLEKASRMLGATSWQTFRRVLFPLMVPGIAIAFCLNFVMAFSVFPSAVLLGQPSGPQRVIALAAYQWAFEKFKFNAASAVTMIMAAIELAVIALVLAWRSGMYKGSSIVGKG